MTTTNKEIKKIIEYRGWKEICPFLGVKYKFTARRRLKSLSLLVYEGNRPVLNAEAYRLASLKRHVY